MHVSPGQSPTPGSASEQDDAEMKLSLQKFEQMNSAVGDLSMMGGDLNEKLTSFSAAMQRMANELQGNILEAVKRAEAAEAERDSLMQQQGDSASTVELKAQRRCVRSSLARGMRRLCHFTEHRQRFKQLCRRVVTRLKAQELVGGFQAWLDHVARSRRARAVMKAVLNRWNWRNVSRGFNRWNEMVLNRFTSRRLASNVMKNWKNSGLRAGYCRWMEIVEDLRVARGWQKRSVRIFQNHALYRGFNTWLGSRGLSQQNQHQQKLLNNIARRWRGGIIFTAFREWREQVEECAQKRWKLSLREGILRQIGARWMYGRKFRCFDCWSATVYERRSTRHRHRAILGNAARRIRNLDISKGFSTWRYEVKSLKEDRYRATLNSTKQAEENARLQRDGSMREKKSIEEQLNHVIAELERERELNKGIRAQKALLVEEVEELKKSHELVSNGAQQARYDLDASKATNDELRECIRQLESRQETLADTNRCLMLELDSLRYSRDNAEKDKDDLISQLGLFRGSTREQLDMNMALLKAESMPLDREGCIILDKILSRYENSGLMSSTGYQADEGKQFKQALNTIKAQIVGIAGEQLSGMPWNVGVTVIKRIPAHQLITMFNAMQELVVMYDTLSEGYKDTLVAALEVNLNAALLLALARFIKNEYSDRLRGYGIKVNDKRFVSRGSSLGTLPGQSPRSASPTRKSLTIDTGSRRPSQSGDGPSKSPRGSMPSAVPKRVASTPRASLTSGSNTPGNRNSGSLMYAIGNDS